MPHRLLVATFNQAKARELAQLLSDLPGELVTPREVGITTAPPEEGNTLEDNAVAKALYYHRLSGLLTLAEDSGLEVDALGGEPGVRSARFAGEGASDEDNIRLLLERLRGVPGERRQARFRCVMAVAAGGATVELFRGECEGIIAERPRGKGGFGYDPVFLVPELGKTFAQLPPGLKNRLSHRGRAARLAASFLRQLLAEPHATESTQAGVR
ncbi:MAG: RdgB/HAM1 family non-canonical purine NTP pyrophosphatase [Chloroflexota bacterium]